jgi:thiamine-phosphate pyrophosphorylase
VYVVSSRRRLAPGARTQADEIRALERWIHEVVLAGPDVLQIRERDLPASALCEIGRQARRVAEGRPTRILVNDRADVALAADAHGVHLPASGLPVPAARVIMPEWIVGRSLHTSGEVVELARADYGLFGTVFASRSKGDQAAKPAGLEALAGIARRAPCPVIAIGGITAESAGECRRMGASGVAAIGLFLPEGIERDALGPAAAVRALRDAMRRASVE